jgi:hypothetical protein
MFAKRRRMVAPVGRGNVNGSNGLAIDPELTGAASMSNLPFAAQRPARSWETDVAAEARLRRRADRPQSACHLADHAWMPLTARNIHAPFVSVMNVAHMTAVNTR